MASMKRLLHWAAGDREKESEALAEEAQDVVAEEVADPSEATDRSEAAACTRAGNTAIHLFSVAFLERVTQGSQRLAFHLARKKVPYYDPATGVVMKPAVENALKFELFVFDALPLAERWLTVRVDRADEFAPLKNATGADSPEAVRAAISDFHARSLRAAGVEVAEGVPVEVAALFALSDGELRDKIPAGTRVVVPTLFE